jgi:hypothetical protein
MSALNKMSRLVCIGKNMVELSGLHGIWVGPDHLSGSRITLYYLNHRTEQITYECGKWEECDKDAKILECAKKEFNKTIGQNALQ